jgi:hypothetical protein
MKIKKCLTKNKLIMDHNHICIKIQNFFRINTIIIFLNNLSKIKTELIFISQLIEKILKIICEI